MRISDGSSDLCSSDLMGYEYDFETGQNLFDTYYVNNSGGLTSGRQPTDSFPPNIYSYLSSFLPGGVFSGKSSSLDHFYRHGVLVPPCPALHTGEPILHGYIEHGHTGYLLPHPRHTQRVL